MAEHKHPNYKKIYFALLGLLVVSVAGPFIGILWVTLLTAFGIALVKANLVIQNFMHLKWERVIMKWLLGTSLVLMGLMFAGISVDVMKHEGNNWENVAAKAAVARGISDEEHAEEEHVEEPTVVAQPAGFDPAGQYQLLCASCHGATGAGDGAAAAALDPKPASFADAAFWETRTDEELVRVILLGGQATGKSTVMPAWNLLLDDEKAQQMVEYLKTMQVGG